MATMIETGKLIYEGREVGSRVIFKEVEYDISTKDLEVSKSDFNISVVNAHKPKGFKLGKSGDLLVPIHDVNMRELTYGNIAELLGYRELNKTDAELKGLYNTYNKKYFDGELPTYLAVEWSKRQTATAGSCTIIKVNRKYVPKVIKISTHFHNNHDDELEDTLVHEMIHARYPGDSHGGMFKVKMDELNAKYGLNLSVYTDKIAIINYLYLCQDCGYEYKRTNRIHRYRQSRCGVCEGRLDEVNLKEG